MRRKKLKTERRGDVPVFAVFAIFSILIAGLAITHFRTTRQQTSKSIRRVTAADIVRTRASAIESDLNETLQSAITAAMWEVGTEGGVKENVKDRVIETLNKRIENGWRYDTVKEKIPKVDDNKLDFVWQPDGSVVVYGLLNAEVSHVIGPSVWGVELYSNPEIRFQRIKKVSEIVIDKVEKGSNLEKFEDQINENYRLEGLKINIIKENGLMVEVKDIFGGQTVIKP